MSAEKEWGYLEFLWRGWRMVVKCIFRGYVQPEVSGVVCPDKAVPSLENALPSYQNAGHSGQLSLAMAVR